MAFRKANGRLLSLYNWLLRPIPFGFFSALKKYYLRFCGVNISQSVSLAPDVTIRGNGSISIGANTVLSQGCCIESNGGTLIIGARCEVNYGTLIAANLGSTITIGDDVHVAHHCSIKGSTHSINLNGEGLSIAGEGRFLNIDIGPGSWVCAGVIVLPGVCVGKRNVLAAGAVVTQNTPDSVLMAGVPAMIKKKY